MLFTAENFSNFRHLFKHKGQKLLQPEKIELDNPPPNYHDLGDEQITMDEWEKDPFDAATRWVKGKKWND